jgi:CheY-like chemotaxis protein
MALLEGAWVVASLRGEPIRLLLISDRIPNRETWSKVLSQEGADVTSTESLGTLSIEAGGQFDAVVIDVMTENGRGFVLAYRCLRLGLRPILTGFDSEVQVLAREHGLRYIPASELSVTRIQPLLD